MSAQVVRGVGPRPTPKLGALVALRGPAQPFRNQAAVLTPPSNAEGGRAIRTRREYRYSALMAPRPCPEHDRCLITGCHRIECRNEIHVRLFGRGQPA